MKSLKFSVYPLEVFLATAHFQNIPVSAGADSLRKDNTQIIKNSLSESAA